MKLSEKKCQPCHGEGSRLGADGIALLLPEVPGWQLDGRNTQISKTFRHRDFKEAMGFVNGMAEIAEQEGHHPDFSIRYSTVEVALSTHDVGGLSENDFILAAKIETLRPAA